MSFMSREDSHFVNREAAMLLESGLGSDLGGYVLWNMTCFPFDAEETLRQAKAIIARISGKLEPLKELRIIEDEQNTEMDRLMAGTAS